MRPPGMRGATTASTAEAASAPALRRAPGQRERRPERAARRSAKAPRKSAGSAQSGGGKGGSDEDRSLKEREYRDAEGNVHHHTRTYEEQHGGKGQSR